MTTARQLTRLQPDLQHELHRAVARVAARIEAMTGPEVLADRLDTASPLSPEGSDWLAPWRPARVHFDRRCRILSAGSVLARTDVRRCFAAITPRTVVAALAEAGCHPSEACEIGDVLSRVCEASGEPGLPVGPAASAILANAVLLEADDSIRGFRFLRWVDDYLVFASDEIGAHRALQRLASALQRRGLELAEDKTEVGGSWSKLSMASATGLGRPRDRRTDPDRSLAPLGAGAAL